MIERIFYDSTENRIQRKIFYWAASLPQKSEPQRVASFFQLLSVPTCHTMCLRARDYRRASIIGKPFVMAFTCVLMELAF
jgi:hypothetical protein